MTGKLGKRYRVKDGKVVKAAVRVSVSERLRRKHSRRVKVVRRGGA